MPYILLEDCPNCGAAESQEVGCRRPHWDESKCPYCDSAVDVLGECECGKTWDPDRCPTPKCGRPARMPLWLDFLDEGEPEMDPLLGAVEWLDGALGRDDNGVTLQTEILAFRSRLFERGASLAGIDAVERLLLVVAGERHAAQFNQQADQARDLAAKK